MIYAIIALVLVAVIAFLVMGRKSTDQAPQESQTPQQPTDAGTDLPREPMSPMPQRTQQPAQPPEPAPMQTAPIQPSQATPQTTAPEPVQPAAATATDDVYDYRPPGTSRLDDDGLETPPELAAGALEAARAGISANVPDEVLGEMLLDTTPQQAQQMFARVSPETLQVVTSSQSGLQFEGEASDDDWAALDGLGGAVDDLDIWDFGEDFGEGERIVS